MNRSDILAQADTLITEDRAAIHGDALECFTRIAAMWSGYLLVDIKPADVAVMMQHVKHARIKNSPRHADHWRDIIGYAALGGEITEATDD